MEKITSGLPLSLYHYTHLTITPSPPKNSNPNNPLSFLRFYTSENDPFYCTSTISFSAIIPSSLSSPSYAVPLLCHKGFDFFFLTAIGDTSILVLFTSTY